MKTKLIFAIALLCNGCAVTSNMDGSTVITPDLKSWADIYFFLNPPPAAPVIPSK